MEKKVSLYIHIPFCLSNCVYCDFFSLTDCAGLVEDYISALCNEIKFRLDEYGKCLVKTVYVGGGTPSLLKPHQIETVGRVVKEFARPKNFEFTFEVNPDDVSKQLLQALKDTGVNRISCGVQSFSEEVLKSIHRRAKIQQINNAFSLFRENWPQKLSVDLICGLPGETEQTMLLGLKTLADYAVPHISFYSLCIEEETPLGNAIINKTIKYNSDYSDSLWLKGRDFLLKNGYEQYEISNFCLPGYECIHNMTYWSHKDYIGAGAGATGTIYKKDATGLRWTNTKNIRKYIDFWSKKTGENTKTAVPQEVEIIDRKTSEFEYFMMGLRTKKGISPAEYKKIFNEQIPAPVMELLKRWNDSDRMLFLNVLLEKISEFYQ